MQNAQLLLNPLLHLAVIVPLLLIFMKERTRENYLRVLSIVVCYCLYSIALVLPYLFEWWLELEWQVVWHSVRRSDVFSLSPSVRRQQLLYPQTG